MITVGFSTREHNDELIKYFEKSSGVKGVEVIEVINNGEKNLSQVYNEILQKSKHDIVLLCHDDIYFDTNNWGKKLLNHFNNTDYGILGMAGTTEMPENGQWWSNRNKMVGIVNHESEGKKWESKYSNGFLNQILDVCLVDGVFIAVNKNRIKENFDEEINGFHFYDIVFCTLNYLSNVKIGVIYDIRITHKSIGQTNESWENNRKIYVEKFKNKLPIIHTPKINYSQLKYSKLKKPQNLIVQTSGEGNNVSSFLNNLTNLNLLNSLNITLISSDLNIEKIKQFETDNIKVVEGHFPSLNKNLSILKWDDEFVKIVKDDLIFFTTDTTTILNDVFSSMLKIYQKEKNTLSVIFPTVLNNDYSIFSNGLDIVKNKEEKLNVILKHQSTYYNIFQGHQKSSFGSISPFFATTYTLLNKFEWLDIDFDTDIHSLMLSLKSTSKNLNNYVDTNSVVMNGLDYFKNENVNQDFQKAMMFANQTEELKNKFKTIV